MKDLSHERESPYQAMDFIIIMAELINIITYINIVSIIILASFTYVHTLNLYM